MTKTALVCAAQVPFVRVGAELLVRGLVNGRMRRGSRADRVRAITWDGVVDRLMAYG